MDGQEILLKEYEACQSEINNRGNQFWVSLSIIISINLLLLTQAAYNIIQGSLPISKYANLLAVPILGAVMIIINLFFTKWQVRQHYVTQVIYQRIRKIEDITGMHRNWLIYGLDLKNDPDKQCEWQELTQWRREFIDRLLASYPYLPKHKRAVGDKVFGYVPIILIVLWLALVVVVLLIYFFPIERAWLLN